jgi:addiction module RelE/StbE family toxin
MVKIVWTNYAYRDLKDIFDYISKDSKKYALLQIDRIKKKVKILYKNPKSGRIVPEINHNNIRELIEGNYRIIYLIKSTERIDILSIFHSARILDYGKL